MNSFYTDDLSIWTRTLHPCFVCLLTTADTVMCHELTAQCISHVPVEDLKWVTPILDSVFKGHVVNMLFTRHLLVTQKVKQHCSARDWKQIASDRPLHSLLHICTNPQVLGLQADDVLYCKCIRRQIRTGRGREREQEIFHLGARELKRLWRKYRLPLRRLRHTQKKMFPNFEASWSALQPVILT